MFRSSGGSCAACDDMLAERDAPGLHAWMARQGCSPSGNISEAGKTALAGLSLDGQREGSSAAASTLLWLAPALHWLNTCCQTRVMDFAVLHQTAFRPGMRVKRACEGRGEFRQARWCCGQRWMRTTAAQARRQFDSKAQAAGDIKTPPVSSRL